MPASVVRAEEMKQRYVREAVITATPAGRLLMLFDKMVTELQKADDAFERCDLKGVNDGLCAAQDILLALRGTLRTDLWDGAADLSQLYFALYRELLEANLKKDRSQAQRAAAVVVQLADAWRRAADHEAASPSGAKTPAGVG
jgi:flagellar protein FliS